MKDPNLPIRVSFAPMQTIRRRSYAELLEASIVQSTQSVVFEANGETLWEKVRRTITDYLTIEWRKGGLMGSKPEEAFFVRCDRTTMTQSDLDQGRLICVVGVAPVKPAEFAVLQIGQWTADHKG